jgi:hypothetical protein
MNGRIIDKINGSGADNQVLLTLGSNKLLFSENQRWIIGNVVLIYCESAFNAIKKSNDNVIKCDVS